VEPGWAPGSIRTRGKEIYFLSGTEIDTLMKSQIFISVRLLQTVVCKFMKHKFSVGPSTFFCSVPHVRSVFQETSSLPRLQFISNFSRVSSTKWPKNYTLRLAKGVEMLCSFSSFPPPSLPPPTTKGAESESWQRRTLRGSISVT